MEDNLRSRSFYPSRSDEEEDKRAYVETLPYESDDASTLVGTTRSLKGRHIELIGIGGTIGTALFVQIGVSLTKGGPGSLFLGFLIWTIPILCITNCAAEMVTYLPTSSPFIKMSGRCIDDAVEVMAGWNFFLFEAALVPYEITAVNVILEFWVTGYSPAITFCVQIALYIAINIFAVKFYGESEFWLAIGKVLLATGLIFFTLITMCGGNPQHDAYGFRYWNNPGAFKEYYTTGSTGRFMGFMACLIQACFTIAGPEYVSMTAGEAENPRKTLPHAFKGVFWRLAVFFILGSLCIGIVVPYNDKALLDAINNAAKGAAASPYVIAMARMGIPFLPNLVNALVLTACFSAGNSYMYCASRSLYGLALDGKAPKIFRKTKWGVPYFCVAAVIVFALLSFLQLGKTSQVVLSYIVSLVTASQLINFSVICGSYLAFYYAMKAQGFDRNTLPYKGIGQPFCGWFGLIATIIMTIVGGYEVFLPGKWDIPTFLFSYVMVFVDIVIYVGWKLIKRTKHKRSVNVDLITGVEEIEKYTLEYEAEHQGPKKWYQKILTALIG